ncbi:MAG TPA: riboflavin synthase [Candidatus Polarisedimenticolia bacterium]|nr:riboflavin synthase [Candidatus Polarisedimenticolia bacterium]
MFTGLVETTGRIETLQRAGDEARLRVAAPFAAALRRGASVAVDGVCLTVVRRGRGWFEAVVAPETIACTTLGLKRAGERVNLERPLRLGDRLGGHLVQGHVDGVGVVRAVRQEGSGRRLRIDFPAGLAPLIVMKGSIAVDGVSLTVAARLPGAFEVALIPETLEVTRLGEHTRGTPVNLEVDMLGRYFVQNLKERGELTTPSAPLVTREHLARHGFGGRDGSR